MFGCQFNNHKLGRVAEPGQADDAAGQPPAYDQSGAFFLIKTAGVFGEQAAVSKDAIDSLSAP